MRRLPTFWPHHPSGCRTAHAICRLPDLVARCDQRACELAHHPRSRRLCRGVQGEVRADPQERRARHHRRHLQFGLHAGVRHRTDQQDLRHPARQPGLPPGLLRQGIHLRHQGDELRGHLGPDVLLSEHGEGLDPPQRRPHHRDEEDQERRRPLEDRRPLSGRFLRHRLSSRQRVIYTRCKDPVMTGTQRPPIEVCMTRPFCLTAWASRRLGRPISTPCMMVSERVRSASGRSWASRPTSATLADPVAGSSGMPCSGANIRHWISMPPPLTRV